MAKPSNFRRFQPAPVTQTGASSRSVFGLPNQLGFWSAFSDSIERCRLEQCLAGNWGDGSAGRCTGALWRSESIRRLANPQDRSQFPKRVVIIDRRGIDPFRDSRPTGLNRPLGGCKQVVFGCLIVRQLVCLYHLRTTVGSIWCNLLCFFRVVRDSLPIR